MSGTPLRHPADLPVQRLVLSLVCHVTRSDLLNLSITFLICKTNDGTSLVVSFRFHEITDAGCTVSPSKILYFTRADSLFVVFSRAHVLALDLGALAATVLGIASQHRKRPWRLGSRQMVRASEPAAGCEPAAGLPRPDRCAGGCGAPLLCSQQKWLLLLPSHWMLPARCQ